MTRKPATYILALRAEPAGKDHLRRDPAYCLKLALKVVIRSFGLRCVGIETVKDGAFVEKRHSRGVFPPGAEHATSDLMPLAQSGEPAVDCPAVDAPVGCSGLLHTPCVPVIAAGVCRVGIEFILIGFVAFVLVNIVYYELAHPRLIELRRIFQLWMYLEE